MVLDFSINETASIAELGFSFPISKKEARATLILGNEMTQHFLHLRDKKRGQPYSAQDRHIFEKLFSASCKLTTYMGGYLQQEPDQAEGTAELKAGLQLVLKAFCGAVVPQKEKTDTKGNKILVNDFEAEVTLRLTEDEKYLVYGIFDGLNYLFGLADFKCIETIINNDLFHGLLTLCHLDSYEQEIFARSDRSNEFYQL
jgi:hypothetical protein